MSNRMLLVSYDLNAPGKDYNRLFEALKQAPDWCRPLKSVWLLWTARSANDWSDVIKQHADANDHWLVSEFSASHQGWLPKQVWDWVNAKLALL